MQHLSLWNLFVLVLSWLMPAPLILTFQLLDPFWKISSIRSNWISLCESLLFNHGQSYGWSMMTLCLLHTSSSLPSLWYLSNRFGTYLFRFLSFLLLLWKALDTQALSLVFSRTSYRYFWLLNSLYSPGLCLHQALSHTPTCWYLLMETRVSSSFSICSLNDFSSFLSTFCRAEVIAPRFLDLHCKVWIKALLSLQTYDLTPRVIVLIIFCNSESFYMMDLKTH